MPGRNAPEFSYNEKTKTYRKRIKDEATGRWIDVYGKTKPELRRKVKDRQAQLGAARQATEDPLVFQYAARWFELNTTGVGAKRKEDYRNAINNHICPIIGMLHLRQVTPDNILAVMVAAGNLSKSSQQKIVTTLKRIFDSAVDNDYIARSPCRNLKAGGAPAKEKTPLSKDQQQRLMEALKGTKAGLFAALALYAGLRREEALGLQWDCVHLDAVPPYIAVRRAVRWEGKNTPVVNDTLKSKASRRDIPIPTQLQEILRDAKEKAEGAYVVSDSSSGPMSAASFRRAWDAVRVRSVREITVKENGVKHTKMLKLGDKVRNHPVTISLDFAVTPHQLRHTYITELILSGANIKTVQYLAGHATVNLTLNIYTHLMANKPSDTVSAVTAAFGGKVGGIQTS